MPEKYAFYKDGDTVSDKIWFAHCQKNQIPYVVVRYRKTLADVEWDYITFPSEWDKKLIENESELKHKFINVFQKHASKRSEYTVTCTVASFKGMPIENAKAAAGEIFDVVSGYV